MSSDDLKQAEKVLGKNVVKPEMDALTPAQEELITAFVKAHFESAATVHPTYAYLFERHAPSSSSDKKDEDGEVAANCRIAAYKLLVARKWSPKDAAAMLQDTIGFREQYRFHTRRFFPTPNAIRGYNVEELMQFFNQYQSDTTPSGDEPSASTQKILAPRVANEPIDVVFSRFYGAYANSVHKWDKQGHPIVFEHIGTMDVPLAIKTLHELAPPGTSYTQPMLDWRAFQNEIVSLVIRFNDAKFAAKNDGRRVTSCTAILDCAGVHMGMVTSQTLELMKKVLEVDQKYFPEVLHRMIIINCSPLVMMVYNIIKVVLDARVRSKFFFANPEDTPAVLRTLIDEEHLPTIYGGKCECEGGCVHYLGKQGKVDSSGAAQNAAKTEEIDVPAGSDTRRVIAVTKGHLVAWQWESATGSDVEFEVFRQPKSPAGDSSTSSVDKKSKSGDTNAASKPEDVIVARQRMKEGSDSYTAAEDGEVVIVWCNKFSWLKSKTVRLRVTDISGH